MKTALGPAARFLAASLLSSTLLCACGEPASDPTFVNKVWEVSESSAVAKGTLYVFLSEGTLVVASNTGTPSLGQWKQQNGQLTMIEESIPYPTDILELTPTHFKIRSHNPGEPVIIEFSVAH
jgi:hypothetical protein